MAEYAYRFSSRQDILSLQSVPDQRKQSCVPDSRSLSSFNSYNHEYVILNVWDQGMLTHLNFETYRPTANTANPVTLVRPCTRMHVDMVPGPVAFGNDLTSCEWFPFVSVQNLQYAVEEQR